MAQGGPDWSKGYGTAYAIMGTMLAGPLVWGAIGYLIDLWLGTDPLFVASGILLGMAGSIYLVYLRYGRDQRGR